MKKVSSDLDTEYFVVDVTDENLMIDAIKDISNLNCLVNCAGIAAGAKKLSQVEECTMIYLKKFSK